MPGFSIAYFSMEVGLESDLPTYSGGLGVLAGDTLRAAADFGLSMVGISLVHRNGYFRQRLDSSGNQVESPAPWDPSARLESTSVRAAVRLRGRPVQIRAWRYRLTGLTGRKVPVYLLDTDLPENDPADRTLTDHLYGGDAAYRLSQEVILGIGGLAVLRALGHAKETTLYHMNEGHSALLTLALVEEEAGTTGPAAVSDATREAVRKRCVFTTHTPVPAGHDQFHGDLVRDILGPDRTALLEAGHCCLAGTLNMTNLALVHSHYVNGVGLRHEQISRDMFPGYPINSVTNGVHAVTWATKPVQALFDRHIPEWRLDNLYLRYAMFLSPAEILQAHMECKRELLSEVERRIQVKLDPKALTLGFARRATPYKRPDLLFTDLERLRRIAQRVGPL